MMKKFLLKLNGWTHARCPEHCPFSLWSGGPTSQRPNTNMIWHDFLECDVGEASNGRELLLDIFFVFKDVRLSSKHSWARAVSGADVHDCKGASFTKQTANFTKDAIPS